MIAIVVSEFNLEISKNLLEGAKLQYQKNFGKEKYFDDIKVFYVPGAFEIPGLVTNLVNQNLYDAIVTYGSIIKGETAHFDYISNAVTKGLMDISVRVTTNIPILFGVLTAYDYDQALIRSDINKKNKGGEVMQAAIDIIKVYKK